MSRNWESWFETWGHPPSKTEQDEISGIEQRVKAALNSHARIGAKRVHIYGKGSHVRGTNVRRGSDIDLAVELRGDDRTGNSWITKKAFRAESMTQQDLGLVDVDLGYNVKSLKDDIYEALVSEFGQPAVERQDKCIELKEGVLPLSVDVVACRTVRRYDDKGVFHEGILIKPDKGGEIVNWPAQDKDNTSSKNSATSTRFKRAVRGLKALENDMVEARAIQPVPSFLLECAVYNVPNSDFASPSNYSNCLTALRVMGVAGADGSYESWEETNQLKYLFRGTNKWTVKDMNRFVTAAVDYLEGS